VGEAMDLFAGIRQELEAQNKKIIDNCLQMFVTQTSVQAVQKTLGVVSQRRDEVNEVLAIIMESIKTIPSKRELRQQQVLMDEKLAHAKEIHTGLNTAMYQ
jgi:aconitase B